MTLHELIVRDLQDLYQSESEQARHLPELAHAASTGELRAALEDHLNETRQQISRIQQILDMIGESPGGSGGVSSGVQGLLTEAREKINGIQDPGLRDLAIIAAAQKMEHYEIACYGTARAMAHTLGMDDAAHLLQDTLTEEETTDKRLTHIALPLLKKVAQNEPAEV